MKRTSVPSHYQQDFAGDDSAVRCQQAVQEVLDAQQKFKG